MARKRGRKQWRSWSSAWCIFREQLLGAMVGSNGRRVAVAINGKSGRNIGRNKKPGAIAESSGREKLQGAMAGALAGAAAGNSGWKELQGAVARSNDWINIQGGGWEQRPAAVARTLAGSVATCRRYGKKRLPEQRPGEVAGRRGWSSGREKRSRAAAGTMAGKSCRENLLGAVARAMPGSSSRKEWPGAVARELARSSGQ